MKNTHKIIFILSIIVSVVLCNSLPVKAYDIRIGLSVNTANPYIASQYDAILINTGTRKGIVQLNGMHKYDAFAKNNVIHLKRSNDGKILSTNASSVDLVPKDTRGLVSTKDRWYRGSLRIEAHNNTVTVINIVDIEEYLMGVVPSEMPAVWNIEALKAQAIAARSYALANVGKRASKGFDLLDTPQDQAYKGACAETAKSSKAVAETDGMVLVSHNAVIPAYYHSSSGGATDNYGWSKVIDFVRPVRDFDSESPSASWEKSLAESQFSSTLARCGYNVGSILSVTPSEKTLSGRVKTLTIAGTEGTKSIDGTKFQSIFGLKSNLFQVSKQGSTIVIAGRGNGHGIGMSQWGAKSLAEKGCNAFQIIGYYYQNIQIKRLS